MSLEAILRTIEKEGEQTICQIKAESEQRVQSMLEEARAQAEKAKREWFEKRETEALAESAQILQHANHEAVAIRQQVYSQITDAVLQTIREQLFSLRERVDYGDVLEHLILEAYQLLSSSLIPGEKPCIEADSRDEPIVRHLLKSDEFSQAIGSPIVHYVLNCCGGINLRNEDGRIVVQNTLENRFEQAIPDIRRYLASLFVSEVFAEIQT